MTALYCTPIKRRSTCLDILFLGILVPLATVAHCNVGRSVPPFSSTSDTNAKSKALVTKDFVLAAEVGAALH